ncbi:MAG TPA: hotdog domain-containing protein, partial [Acidimicrobiales bacterium]|nr:hotdog domain-containing protein [Acidimicrobiales bacterium]
MTATAGTTDSEPARHVLLDLGWKVWRAGAALRGAAPVVPEMHVPGTEHLRTSILAAWADTLAGVLAVDLMDRRVPVTLELDVHLYRPAPGAGTVSGTGKVVKSGRSVFVASVDFADDAGRTFAFAAAAFMPAPGVTTRMPPRATGDGILPGGGRLEVPFAERAG